MSSKDKTSQQLDIKHLIKYKTLIRNQKCNYSAPKSNRVVIYYYRSIGTEDVSIIYNRANNTLTYNGIYYLITCPDNSDISIYPGLNKSETDIVFERISNYLIDDLSSYYHIERELNTILKINSLDIDILYNHIPNQKCSYKMVLESNQCLTDNEVYDIGAAILKHNDVSFCNGNLIDIGRVIKDENGKNFKQYIVMI